MLCIFAHSIAGLCRGRDFAVTKCTALYSPIIVFGIVFSFLFGNIISYAKEGVMHGKMANWFLQRVNKDNDFDSNRKNSDRA